TACRTEVSLGPLSLPNSAGNENLARKLVMRKLAFRVGNRRQKRDFGAARIEPRVLHNDRNVRFEHRGIVGVARDRLRVVEIVEPQAQRAPGGDGHAVGADRLPVGEEDGNGDARVLSLALRMQAVSWEMSARSENELSEGM